MNIQDYLQKMKVIQEKIQKYLDNENESEELYHDIINLIHDNKIITNHHEFTTFIYLIAKISNNYHRTPNFYEKILKILKYFHEDIKSNFANFELFNIFKGNKKILLFLINNELLNLDYTICKQFVSKKYRNSNYLEYFYPEIKEFMSEGFAKEILEKIPENDFEINRELGENESKICQLIRNDLIDEFITYINKTNISVNSKIESSIYESNQFLNNFENQPTLIEYSAFFGSIKIFKYLHLNNAKLTPSLWLCAIHGKNAELIHFLEEKQVKPKDEKYLECIKESIKCHHNEITSYLIENFIDESDDTANFILYNHFKYHNFWYIESTMILPSYSLTYSKYNYFDFVKNFLTSENVNTTYNAIIIIYI